MEQLVADPMGADYKTNEGRVWEWLLRAVIDNQPHLLAGASEANRNRYDDRVWLRH